MTSEYIDEVFRGKVEESLEVVRRILDTTKHPQFAPNVFHQYDDKYLLAEHLANMACLSGVTWLRHLGLSMDQIAKVARWAQKHEVTLRMESRRTCELKESKKRKEDSKTESVVQVGVVKVKSKAVYEVEEWFWRYRYSYRTLVYSGSNPSDAERSLDIAARSVSERAAQLVTLSENAPFSKLHTETHEVSLTWLLRRLDDDGALKPLRIDRSHVYCHTPTRNPEVQALVSSLDSFGRSLKSFESYLLSSLGAALPSAKQDPSALAPDTVFVPILPLLEEASAGATLLDNGSALKMLDHHSNTLKDKLESVARVYSGTGDNELLQAGEAQFATLCLHAGDLASMYGRGIQLLEDMLRSQLVAALGKVVTPNELLEYMDYHNRKLFRKEYVPRPFSYAIRRPDHYPDGTLSLNVQAGGGGPERPLPMVTRTEPKGELSFDLYAGTKVRLSGAHHVHSAILLKFSGSSDFRLSLRAYSRQFSSFVVLLGRVDGPDSLDVKAAMIVQNKDDVEIVLDLLDLPTAAEFVHALESLSPEQRAFAQAYRAMQVDSTLFALAVVQIRPALEAVLGLPPDSLTKQIALTQDLLDLFIKYQIPCDLLSYAGAQDASVAAKLAAVQHCVAEVRAMIDECRKEVVARAEEDFLYSILERFALGKPETLVQAYRPVFSEDGGGRRSVGATGALEAPANAVDGKSKKRDYASIPADLMRNYAKRELSAQLRPTVVSLTPQWKRSFYRTLLAEKSSENVSSLGQAQMRLAAYDLLDALSKSGELVLHHADLHVVVLNTYSFPRALMDTLILDNVDPISSIERATLTMASVVHQCPVEDLILPSQRTRLFEIHPQLF